jgi:hypothetical protein
MSSKVLIEEDVRASQLLSEEDRAVSEASIFIKN